MSSKKRKQESDLAHTALAFNPGPGYAKVPAGGSSSWASLIEGGEKEIWLVQLPKKFGLGNMQGLDLSVADGGKQPKKGKQSAADGITEVATFKDEEGCSYVLDGESFGLSNQLHVVLPSADSADGMGGSLMLPIAKRVTMSEARERRADDKAESYAEAEADVKAESLTHDSNVAGDGYELPDKSGKSDKKKKKEKKEKKDREKGEKKDKKYWK